MISPYIALYLTGNTRLIIFFALFPPTLNSHTPGPVMDPYIFIQHTHLALTVQHQCDEARSASHNRFMLTYPVADRQAQCCWGSQSRKNMWFSSFIFLKPWPSFPISHGIMLHKPTVHVGPVLLTPKLQVKFEWCLWREHLSCRDPSCFISNWN